VFSGARLVVFVDGDFWHGNTWAIRKAKLEKGHNPEYWISKIERNIERDRERTRELKVLGWSVLRVWESEVATNRDQVVHRIELALRGRRRRVVSHDKCRYFRVRSTYSQNKQGQEIKRARGQIGEGERQ
jgi:G:T-mismatch repair DNA endonuclease (very short patch repair protein)